MNPTRGKNSKPARPRWPTFAFDWLEDRCVFSVSPLDLAAGTLAFLPAPISTTANFATVTSITYTGPLLTVPTSQVEGRTATFFFDDSQVLPGAFVFTGAGTTGIVATHTFDVPDTSSVELRLTSTEVAQDSLNYQIRVDSSFAPSTATNDLGFAVVIATTPISFSQTSAVTGSTVPPPPAVPVVTPNGNAGPKPAAPPPVEQPPPVPRPAPRLAVLPPVEQAQFEAATTQTAFASRPIFPVSNLEPSVAQSPRPSELASIIYAPTVPADVPELPFRREDVNPPVVLELAAARESKPQPLEETELPALLGTAVEPQEPSRFSDDVSTVLERMSQPTRYILARHEVVPLGESHPESKSNRASYLLLATLIGVGTGHYFHGRREGSVRRELLPRTRAGES